MDNRAEVREFLTSRRAKIGPKDVGLPAGTNRRVDGLRRTEVAVLAGVSVEYYTKLERGAIGGASPEVLDAVAKALRLDDAERAHLFDLAHAAGPVARPPRRRSPKSWTPHQSLQWILDSVTAGPAFVRNGRMDLLATNTLGRAFYKDAYDVLGQPPNLARFTFLDRRSYDFYPDWGSFAEITPRSCAPRPAETRTTRNCTTWSASSPRATRSSVGCGARTTSATTASDSRRSTTRSSVR